MNFDLVQENVIKVKIAPKKGHWQTPHLFEMARNVGPQTQELVIFSEKVTPFNSGFVQKLKYSYFGYFSLCKPPLNLRFCLRNCSKILKLDFIFWADWSKTAHNMGPKIQELAFFSEN